MYDGASCELLCASAKIVDSRDSQVAFSARRDGDCAASGFLPDEPTRFTRLYTMPPRQSETVHLSVSALFSLKTELTPEPYHGWQDRRAMVS
jgi:hypothetical protein